MVMPAQSPGVRPLLVIGYGNTLRQDDGVGPRVAELLGGRGLPGVVTVAGAQLAPEHAEAVARAGAVVFVDALVGGVGPVRLRRLVPADSAQVTTHAADPRTVLALAREVYGRVPRAWMLAVPARQVGFGEDLSPVARLAVDEAVAVLERLVQLRLARLRPPERGGVLAPEGRGGSGHVLFRRQPGV